MAERIKLEELKWESLETILDCKNCDNESCYYYNAQPQTLIECPKRGKLIKIGINYVSAIPVIFLFREVFHFTSEKFFASLFVSLIILFFYDLFFLFIEKLIYKLYEKVEDRRVRKFKAKKQHLEELLMQAEEEERQEWQKVEMAKEIYNKLKKFKKVKPIQMLDSYSKMLEVLKEICQDLRPEHFENYEINLLFHVQLQEVIEACQEIIAQYDRKVLSKEEKELFKTIIKETIKRFENVKEIIWQPKREELYVSLERLKKEMETANEYDKNSQTLSEIVRHHENKEEKHEKK